MKVLENIYYINNIDKFRILMEQLHRKGYRWAGSSGSLLCESNAIRHCEKYIFVYSDKRISHAFDSSYAENKSKREGVPITYSLKKTNSENYR